MQAHKKTSAQALAPNRDTGSPDRSNPILPEDPRELRPFVNPIMGEAPEGAFVNQDGRAFAYMVYAPGAHYSPWPGDVVISDGVRDRTFWPARYNPEADQWEAVGDGARMMAGEVVESYRLRTADDLRMMTIRAMVAAFYDHEPEAYRGDLAYDAARIAMADVGAVFYWGLRTTGTVLTDSRAAISMFERAAGPHVWHKVEVGGDVERVADHG